MYLCYLVFFISLVSSVFYINSKPCCCYSSFKKIPENGGSTNSGNERGSKDKPENPPVENKKLEENKKKKELANRIYDSIDREMKNVDKYVNECDESKKKCDDCGVNKELKESLGEALGRLLVDFKKNRDLLKDSLNSVSRDIGKFESLKIVDDRFDELKVNLSEKSVKLKDINDSIVLIEAKISGKIFKVQGTSYEFVLSDDNIVHVYYKTLIWSSREKWESGMEFSSENVKKLLEEGEDDKRELHFFVEGEKDEDSGNVLRILNGDFKEK